jgi:hypothetical protein
MASFHQHVAASMALGVGYGAAACFGMQIDWATCVIAGGLTGLAGMLPDLDAPTGQPVREVFGLAATLAPVLLIKQLSAGVSLVHDRLVGGDVELTPPQVVIVMAACYFAVRFVAAWLLDKLTVHRGMWHSIPAALITAAVAFLVLDGPNPMTRLFLAGGPFLGFMSHLVMDEIWSLRVSGGDVQVKKSAGTAMKFFSNSIPATLAAYVILLSLCWALLHDPSVDDAIAQLRNHPATPRLASEVMDQLRR